MPITFPLNEWQKVAARAYGDGDFAYFADNEDELGFRDREALINNEIGDTSFYGVMIELDESEDCESAAQAANRIQTILDDLQAVHTALTLLA